MKKQLLLVAMFILSCTSFAQSFKIMNSAAGVLKKFESLYEGEELFGYVEIRDLGQDSKLVDRFSYNVMDKNLNKIVEGEFTSEFLQKNRSPWEKSVAVSYSNGKLLIGLTEYYFAQSGLYLPIRDSYSVLDLDTNKISASGVFDEKTDFSRNRRFLAKNFIPYNIVSALPEGKFLMQALKIEKKKKEKYYFAIDADGKKLWEQPFETAERKHKFKYEVVKTEGNTILFIATKYKGDDKKVSDHLMAVDAKTGAKMSFCDYSNDVKTLRYSSVFIKNDQVTFVGRYFKKKKRDEVKGDKSLGLYRRIIDLKSGKIVSDVFVPYSKLGIEKISENGKIKKDGLLDFQNFTLNPDGTVFVVAETYVPKKRGAMYNEVYTFQFDKDFNLENVQSIDTKRTRGYKYAFSQNLPNKVGKTFFYYDKDENKELELNMLNFDYTSKATQINKIKLKSEESSVKVLPAKSGYITVIEYFKDPKKTGKYMEMRLEKLNYERS